MMRLVFSRLFAAALFAALSFAQVRSGTIVGSVVDSTGAPAVDVEVTVLGTLTNASQTIRTNSAGEFNVPYLAYGTYNVSARKADFKQVSRTGIALTTNQTVRRGLAVGSRCRGDLGDDFQFGARGGAANIATICRTIPTRAAVTTCRVGPISPLALSIRPATRTLVGARGDGLSLRR